MGKYVISKTVKGNPRFDLVAGNGEVILSSQIYQARKGALKGIRSVIKNAPIAAVVDFTDKKAKDEKNPKFAIKKAKNGEVFFELIAANGQVIGVSETYTTMIACKNGIKSVKKNAKSEIEKPVVAKKPVAKKPVAKKTAAKKAVAKKPVKKVAAKKPVKKVTKKVTKKK